MNGKILVQAFHILYGPDWKSNYTNSHKIDEMRSILLGGTKPCVSFEHWVKLVNFLQPYIDRINTETEKKKNSITFVEFIGKTSNSKLT